MTWEHFLTLFCLTAFIIVYQNQQIYNIHKLKLIRSAMFNFVMSSCNKYKFVNKCKQLIVLCCTCVRTIFYYYKQTQRLMPPSLKTRQMQIKEKLKRFHFDPCPKVHRNTSGYSKQKISDIIMAEDHVDFSTVNDKNDFNDSSWLAKLVNGIQEHSSAFIKQPLSDIGVQLQLAENCQKNMLCPVESRQTTEATRKNSSLSQKNTSRKSVPSISSTKRVRQPKGSFQAATLIQKQEKKVEKPIQKGSKPKYERWTSQQSQLFCQPRKSIKNYEKRGKINAKEQTRETHKNSLVNYSSIQEDDINSDLKQDKIVIDLDDITLKTEISRQNTPIQAKIHFQEGINKDKESMCKKNKRKSQNKQNQIHKTSNGQNLMLKFQKQQKSDKKVHDEEKSVKRLQNSPILHNKSLGKQSQHNNNIRISSKPVSQKEENSIQAHNIPSSIPPTPIIQNVGNEAIFTSHNQFLDTFKIPSSIEVAPKFGAIRKNINNKKMDEPISHKLKIRQPDYDSNLEVRFPTFNQKSTQYSGAFSKIDTNRNTQPAPSPSKQPQSIIKKQIISWKQTEQMGLQKQRKSLHTHQFPIESPKFCYPLSSNSGLPSVTSRSPQKYGCNFSLMFRRLNIKHEQIIHKDNCEERALNEEQKYEIGSILSKIKYLNRTYNEIEFINQCKRLHQKNQNFEIAGLDQPQAIKMRPSNEKYKSGSLKKQRQKNYLRGEENTNIENLMGKQSDKKMSQNQIIRQSEPHQNWFSPLFPQTEQIKTESLAPNKCPYLEMPSIQINKAQVECSSKGDIGTIIDSLNSKLTNYIQTNNLEDTYRKFKLEFAQLRRNMQY